MTKAVICLKSSSGDDTVNIVIDGSTPSSTNSSSLQAIENIKNNIIKKLLIIIITITAVIIIIIIIITITIIIIIITLTKE